MAGVWWESFFSFRHVILWDRSQALRLGRKRLDLLSYLGIPFPSFGVRISTEPGAHQ